MTCRERVTLVPRLAETDREMVHHTAQGSDTAGINAGIYTLLILARLD